MISSNNGKTHPLFISRELCSELRPCNSLRYTYFRTQRYTSVPSLWRAERVACPSIELPSIHCAHIHITHPINFPIKPPILAFSQYFRRPEYKTISSAHLARAMNFRLSDVKNICRDAFKGYVPRRLVTTLISCLFCSYSTQLFLLRSIESTEFLYATTALTRSLLNLPAP